MRSVEAYQRCLQNEEFNAQIRDIIKVGLARYKDKYTKGKSEDTPFVLYEKYSRRDVSLLMNCSGFGKFSAVLDTPLEVNLNMTDLNCQAVVAMCQLTVPYMPRGGQIINIASVAAFQPIPYIDIYGATKAFVLSFSRALNRELRKQGIGVMAVCPFWTKTAFFDRAVTSGERVVKKYIAMYDPDDIVRRTWRDAKRGKDVCKYGFVARVQAALTKILPHSLVMNVWMKQQRLS